MVVGGGHPASTASTTSSRDPLDGDLGAIAVCFVLIYALVVGGVGAIVQNSSSTVLSFTAAALSRCCSSRCSPAPGASRIASCTGTARRPMRCSRRSRSDGGPRERRRARRDGARGRRGHRREGRRRLAEAKTTRCIRRRAGTDNGAEGRSAPGARRRSARCSGPTSRCRSDTMTSCLERWPSPCRRPSRRRTPPGSCCPTSPGRPDSAPQCAPHRGAPRVAEASGHGAGRGASEARAKYRRRAQQQLVALMVRLRLAQGMVDKRPRIGEAIAHRVVGCDAVGPGRPARPGAWDLSAAPRRPRAPCGAGGAGEEVSGRRGAGGERDRTTSAGDRSRPVLLLARSAPECREIRRSIVGHDRISGREDWCNSRSR